ncbi:MULTISPECIES: NADH-quinone oxidoreductase subunit L [unclassified Nitrospina]|uniref:NADH-quinone oxidoreductase subunit L n=1 Tax=unclassified Nitrospina TaxID=2638683 RepID=UPI003F9578EB
MYSIAWLILLFPLLGFLILSWFGSRLPKTWVGWGGSGTIGAAFGVVLLIFASMAGGEGDPGGSVEVLYHWIESEKFSLDLAILVDRLSIFMLLVVTGVGFVIHVYSIGYMREDPEYARFFSYMNLFIFSMSVLVLAADFFFLIVGWALVGLASYLLIGFWTEKRSAVLAARKAFVMNVIGDVGMVIAAFMIFERFGSLSYTEVFSQTQSGFIPNEGTILMITLLLLVGAFAKSAQLPLHTWLPDAMEGPTPVSALIHAATMVTAGVYLVARCNSLYTLAPWVMYFVAFVGAATAIFAGTIALTQYDIKRIIAYSTMSQIGYMFLAVGVGVFSAGMFHLMTHAFFKALLFLGAGSVIHALNDEQDIRKMGGLARSMPITFGTFLVASLALTGFPLTAGFYSKEAIIMHSWFAEEYGNWLFWLMAVVATGLTGFYTFRLFFYTFLGNLRHPTAHPHESPLVMTGPLLILAVFSLLGGAFGHSVDTFLAPVFGGAVPVHHENIVLETAPLLVALVGILGAVGLFMTGSGQLGFLQQVLAPVHDLLYNKYYVDEIYDLLIVKPVKATGKFLEERAEKFGIDFSVDQVGAQMREVSRQISIWQSGNVRLYALNMVAGLITVLLFVIFL